jgi:hypothetical protein
MSSELRARRLLKASVMVAAAAGLAAIGQAAGPRFYPDDPIWLDNDRVMDAASAQEIEASDYFDFGENSFLNPGERSSIKAVNVNTVDEVPDSSWFQNRIGRRPMSIEEIVRGPDRSDTLSVDGWPIVQGKNEGLQPGWRVVDPATRSLYQVEFDPPSNPEMASGAEMIGTAFYHAFGYNVVEDYIAEIDPRNLRIDPKATIKDITGKRRPMTMGDVQWILGRAARRPNGRYRAIVSRFAPGAPLGSFRYHGTRPDDPNDIFPHEHRRELRANRVFAAWLNHDDSRGINSLSMLEQGADGKKYARHYMFDFGSIMGSGTDKPQTPRAGNEYIVDWHAGFKTLATLGLWIRPWLTIDYPNAPRSVGNFEAERFAPLDWKPEYPNVAFDNMRPDDAFWAARIVSKFSNDIIQAVVRKGAYTDPRAVDYITGVLIRRRDKVLQTWLTGVNPLVEPELSAAGALTFENAAVDAKVASPPERYIVTWSHFDNLADTHNPVGQETTATEPRAEAPSNLLAVGEYVAAMVKTVHPEYPHWSQPVRFYFRREAGGWKTVGIDRDVVSEEEQP